jgi:ABC-type antimicrobial peptide transport system permease subunit
MFAIFALIALVLSAVGIYAVTAYSITQRTQEIGLRMALGAQPGQVVWFVMRRGLLQLGLGLAIGLFGAAGVGQVMEGLLVQISPTDPTTVAMILLVLSAVTVLACLGPATRASRLDPADALRLD